MLSAMQCLHIIHLQITYGTCVMKHNRQDTKKQNNNTMPIMQIYKIRLRRTYVIGEIYLGQRQHFHMGTLRNSA